MNFVTSDEGTVITFFCLFSYWLETHAEILTGLKKEKRIPEICFRILKEISNVGEVIKQD